MVLMPICLILIVTVTICGKGARPTFHVLCTFRCVCVGYGRLFVLLSVHDCALFVSAICFMVVFYLCLFTFVCSLSVAILLLNKDQHCNHGVDAVAVVNDYGFNFGY